VFKDIHADMQLPRFALIATSLVLSTNASPSSTGGYTGPSADPLNIRATSLCPDASPGSKSDGYEVYCSYVVDPYNAGNTILPADTNIATFEACLKLCDNTDDCTGVSYIEASTTCYMHKGDHKAAYKREGWDGAMKVGTNVVSTDSSSTTSAKSQSSSTTSTTTDTCDTTSSADSASTSKDGTPPPGLKAGILIGSASFGVSLVLLVVFFIRKRRNKKTWTIRYPIDPSLRTPANQQSRWSRLRAQLLAQQRRGNTPSDDGAARKKDISSPMDVVAREPTLAPKASPVTVPPARPARPTVTLSPAVEIGARHSRHEMYGNSMYPAELESSAVSPQSHPSYSSAGSREAAVQESGYGHGEGEGEGAVGDGRYSFEPEWDPLRARTMREI